MNWYSVFYWLTVSDNVKKFFDTSSNIFTTATVICGICLIAGIIGKAANTYEERSKNAEEDAVTPALRAWEFFRRQAARMFYVSLTLAILTWTGYVMTPSKKDCLLIVAGGAVGNFITSDSSAKALPSDVMSFLHLSIQKEIKELGQEAQAEFGVMSVKDRFLDKAKELSKEQILELIRNDTTFVKSK